MFCLRERIYCTAVNRVFGFSRYTKDAKVRSDIKNEMSASIGGELANTTTNVKLVPKSPVVMMEDQRRLLAPKVSMDGAIVAEAIELRNRLQEIGSKLLEELAYKTNEKNSRGAKRAAAETDAGNIANVLARQIAQESFEKITSGASPTEIRRGVVLAVNEIKNHLKVISRPVSTPDDIRQVAGIYAGDKSVCDVVCEAIKKVCRDGVIYVRRGKCHNSFDKIEFVDGMRLNSGFTSPYFINTTQGGQINFQEALILLLSDEIKSVESIMPVIELARSRNMPLLIIAKDIDLNSLRKLVFHRMKSNLSVAFVKAPGLGDRRKAILKDIAISTGGEVFGNENNMARLENIQFKDLGRVNNVVISKDQTLLFNGMGKRSEIDRRVEVIKEQIAEATTKFRKRMLRERLRNLVSNAVLINVGGGSEKAVKERIERINDVLETTRAAMEEGIVPGGGIALLKCTSCLDTVVGCNKAQRMGVDIVRRALRKPCFSMALKAGMDASLIESHIEDQSDYCYGYDMPKGEFGLFLEMGLVEPTKLVRKAIEEAACVTSLLTKAESIIEKLPRSN